jgi:hypothetical protein
MGRRSSFRMPTNDYKQRFDIFICGGSQHVEALARLLPKLLPYGTVHLASSYLSEIDLFALHGLYDVLHTPRYSRDGYHNFELFSIRDINRIATAPHFIKLDADVEVEHEWIAYVEECIAARPDAVLFGPRRGNVDVTWEISGPLVRRMLQRDIHVSHGNKVIGGFYVGQTAFFKENLRLMNVVHEFVWCFENGVRRRPSPNPEYWPGRPPRRARLTVSGGSPNFRGNEDTMRSLVVHAAGAGDRLHVLDSGGRIRIFRKNGMIA